MGLDHEKRLLRHTHMVTAQQAGLCNETAGALN
jgi:hypothetical protein